MVDQSEQATENSTDEDAEIPVAKDITEIESWGDAKDVAIDGFDKLRNSSAEDIKKTGLKAVNRIARAWRQLVDGD